MIPFASYSAHAGNARQGHLTRLPQLSAGAPIDPAGRGVRGLSGWWKQGPPHPRRPLSAYNMLSAGVSPSSYSIHSHNSTERGEVIGFDLYAGGSC